MNNHQLTPSEAQAVIRRYAHDLRNMLCSMDLGISCLLEEPESARCEAPQKLLHQLALTEEIVRSLSLRFQEPSRSTAPAADIFESWRRQREKLWHGVPVHWEESSCQAAITVDSTAIVTVLCEICILAKWPAGLVAGFARTDHAVCFSIREPASLQAYRENKPQAQQWKEWQRLVRLSGGKIERSYDALAGRTVTALRFAAHESQSGQTSRTRVSRIPRPGTFSGAENAA